MRLHFSRGPGSNHCQPWWLMHSQPLCVYVGYGNCPPLSAVLHGVSIERLSSSLCYFYWAPTFGAPAGAWGGTAGSEVRLTFLKLRPPLGTEPCTSHRNVSPACVGLFLQYGQSGHWGNSRRVGMERKLTFVTFIGSLVFHVPICFLCSLTPGVHLFGRYRAG